MYDFVLDINECESYPCLHGTCVDQFNGYNCTCEGGYSGILCEIGRWKRFCDLMAI